MCWKNCTFPLPLATLPHITQPTKYELHTAHMPGPRSALRAENMQSTHCGSDLEWTCSLLRGRAIWQRVARHRAAATSDQLLALSRECQQSRSTNQPRSVSYITQPRGPSSASWRELFPSQGPRPRDRPLRLCSQSVSLLVSWVGTECTVQKN